LNSQSVVNKINELACLATEFKPDIILVTESWCNDQISNAYLSIPGYQLQPDLRVDRKDTTNGAGGGLLTYSRDGIDILPSDKSSVFIQHSSFKVKMNTMTTTLHLVYRPPSSNDMAGLVNIIKNVDPGSILIGDFNLPGIDWQNGTSDNKSKDFMEAAEEKFLEQLVDFPTHTTGNTLDLVLTNSSEMVESIISAGRIGKSDHEMLLIKLAGGPPPPPCSPPIPNWDRADWQGFREEAGRGSSNRVKTATAQRKGNVVNVICMGMNRGMQDITCIWDCFFYAVAAAAAAARNESKVTQRYIRTEPTRI
jgi:hypothetical protein